MRKYEDEEKELKILMLQRFFIFLIFIFMLCTKSGEGEDDFISLCHNLGDINCMYTATFSDAINLCSPPPTNEKKE